MIKFSTNFGKTMNAATEITMYANVITQQQDISIGELPNLPQHQQTARIHAENWLKNIWPGIIDTTKDIIGYAKIFDSAYEELTSLVKRLENGDDDAKEQFKQILKIVLLPGFQRANISRIVSNTRTFQQNLDSDYKNFESDSEVAKRAYTKESGELAELQTNEEAAQQEVQGLQTAIIAAAAALSALVAAFAIVSIFSFGLGSGAMAAGIVAATATEAVLSASYASAVQKEHSLQSQIQQEQHELASLNAVRNQLGGFAGSTSKTTSAAQSVADGWSALGDDLDNLVQQLDRISPQEAAILIRTQLCAAHADWEVVLAQAKVLEPSSQIPVKQFNDMESFLKDISPK